VVYSYRQSVLVFFFLGRSDGIVTLKENGTNETITFASGNETIFRFNDLPNALLSESTTPAIVANPAVPLFDNPILHFTLSIRF